MTISTERVRRASKLNERLEAFRDPETKNILLTPGEAKGILLDTLLGFYRRYISEGVPPFNRPSPKIEALAQIVEAQGSEDRFDFTETVESISRDRAQQDQKRREAERKLNIITPQEPPQREI